MAPVKGTITVVEATEGHQANLERLGYVVRRGEDGEGADARTCLFVEGKEWVGGTRDHPIEVTKENLKAIVARKGLFTYKSVFLFPNGKKVYGFPAIRLLGEMSCLVVQPDKGEKSASVGTPISVDDLL